MGAGNDSANSATRKEEMSIHNTHVIICVFVWWALQVVSFIIQKKVEGKTPHRDPISPLIDYAAFAFFLSTIQ